MGHPSYSGDLKTALFTISEGVMPSKYCERRGPWETDPTAINISKFMQSYNYSITLIKRILITFSFLRIKWPLICKNLSPIQPSTRDVSVVLEKKMKM